MHIFPLVKMLGHQKKRKKKEREAALDTTISGPAAFTELSTQQSLLSVAGRQRGLGNLPPSPHIFKKKKEEKKSGFGSGTGSAQIDILLEEVAHQFKIAEEGGI